MNDCKTDLISNKRALDVEFPTISLKIKGGEVILDDEDGHLVNLEKEQINVKSIRKISTITIIESEGSGVTTMTLPDGRVIVKRS